MRSCNELGHGSSAQTMPKKQHLNSVNTNEQIGRVIRQFTADIEKNQRKFVQVHKFINIENSNTDSNNEFKQHN